jgi:hypothetical protein
MSQKPQIRKVTAIAKPSMLAKPKTQTASPEKKEIVPLPRKKIYDPSITAFANLSAAYEKQCLWEYVEESTTRAMELLPDDDVEMTE